jgi:hydrogenase nickel incorporation protein HypA/HybF
MRPAQFGSRCGFRLQQAAPIMHEVGIIQSALEAAVRRAREAGAREIQGLRLRVGAMTGVVPDALQFAFEVVRQGTLAAQARLEVELVPVRCWCARCQTEFPTEDLLYECPQCGALSSELRGGLELELASLEVA